MQFEDAVNKMFTLLGNSKIMALASAQGEHVSVRNVSCVFYDHKIYFKTDQNFRKTKQMLANPHVAMCWDGVQVEGIACNKGLVVEEEGRRFEAAYRKYLWGSYNAYSHEDSEILIEVIPQFVEIWDQDEEHRGYQTFIDFEQKHVEVVYYDEKR
ncbi:MAG: pyridoxamine 5'-phosphate oxidase family protein [Erysipelotrichaceae bacterium]|nr:pyridoxamine 5'-phosphate oxidase family protein [Erysipelotrichaceae bacterium]MCI9312849.1 pyridoxamine 5'-phosphate oxidase family protein [Erysipelotrichaceae bacterium]